MDLYGLWDIVVQDFHNLLHILVDELVVELTMQPKSIEIRFGESGVAPTYCHNFFHSFHLFAVGV